MPRIRFGHKHMKINRALLISSVPTTNIKPCIRSLYIYTSFLKHTACNNSCGNIDNPPQIPPATICILLLGIYFMPISKNGIHILWFFKWNCIRMMLFVWKTIFVSIIFACIMKNHIILSSVNSKVSVPYKLRFVFPILT